MAGPVRSRVVCIIAGIMILTLLVGPVSGSQSTSAEFTNPLQGVLDSVITTASSGFTTAWGMLSGPPVVISQFIISSVQTVAPPTLPLQVVSSSIPSGTNGAPSGAPVAPQPPSGPPGSSVNPSPINPSVAKVAQVVIPPVDPVSPAATAAKVDPVVSQVAPKPPEAPKPPVAPAPQSDTNSAGPPGGYFTTPTPNPYPIITSISPTGGLPAGGTSVTINGYDFIYVSGVTFGSTAAASYTVNSASQIIATSPAGSPGTVHITITNNRGTSSTSSADQFTYYGVPAVTGVSPANGPADGGNTVTITGTGLSGATAVKFGGNLSTITSNSATEIKVTAPDSDLGIYDITVTTPYGTSAVVAADKYRYWQKPIIYGVAPLNGPAAGGTTVTITGTHFDAGTATVTFGAVDATSIVIVDDGTITAVSPAGAVGIVDVRVTNYGGTSAINALTKFTYT